MNNLRSRKLFKLSQRTARRRRSRIKKYGAIPGLADVLAGVDSPLGINNFQELQCAKIDVQIQDELSQVNQCLQTCPPSNFHFQDKTITDQQSNAFPYKESQIHDLHNDYDWEMTDLSDCSGNGDNSMEVEEHSEFSYLTAESNILDNFSTLFGTIEDDLNLNDDEVRSLASVGDNNDEDESFLEEDNHVAIDFDPQMEKLYPGAPINVMESALAVLTFSLRHKCNKAFLRDLLRLIDLHCPKTPTSHYLFQKLFDNLAMPIKHIEYCSSCYRQETRVGGKCTECNTETNPSFMLSFSIISQLQTLLQREEFTNNLDYRFKRKKPTCNQVGDIYDGVIYQHQEAYGFLSDRWAVSFTWNSDGAQLYKSSQASIWPLYLIVNELPYEIRFRQENVIMAGLWCGPVKPVANIMLETLIDDLQRLAAGIVMQTAQNGPQFVRGLLLCGTADIPARSMFLNIHSQSGSFCCAKCLIPGERIGGAQVFPYVADVPQRTVENVCEAAEYLQNSAARNQTHQHGVKGFTHLKTLMPDFVRGMAIDVMHGVYMAQKRLLTLWFDPSYHREPFNQSTLTDVVDERMRNIRTPNFIKRKPRSIKKHLSYWKASELKNFFLYYSIPTLFGVIDDVYFNHYLLLVIAIYHLNKDKISQEDIDLADYLLNQFVAQFATLYDKKYMTINIHQWIHLASTVRDLGPLWATSCFGFENLNGQILNLVHGTRFAEKQIASTLQQYFSLPTLIDNMPPGSSKNYCEQLITKKILKLTETIETGVYVVGKCFLMRPIPQYIQNALNSINVFPHNIFSFHRIKISGAVYTSIYYQKSKTTCSACISFKRRGIHKIGLIQQFLKVPSCPCSQICDHKVDFYIVLQECSPVNSFYSACPNVEVPHVKEYAISETSTIISPRAVVNMNVLMNIKNKIYIATPPNVIEKE